MSKLDITTTANQSAFTMPAYGRALGMSTCAPITTAQVIDVPVRDRHVAALVKGAFPGTSAWSPPIC